MRFSALLPTYEYITDMFIAVDRNNSFERKKNNRGLDYGNSTRIQILQIEIMSVYLFLTGTGHKITVIYLNFNRFLFIVCLNVFYVRPGMIYIHLYKRWSKNNK